MIVTERESPREITLVKGAVKAWRKAPGSLNSAVTAAAYYAKKNGCEMVVISGNSYMNRVYHIAKTTDDLTKFGIFGDATIRIVVVTQDLKACYATAMNKPRHVHGPVCRLLGCQMIIGYQ